MAGGPTYNNSGISFPTSSTSWSIAMTGRAALDTTVLFLYNQQGAAGASIQPTSVNDGAAFTMASNWATAAFAQGGGVFVLTNAAAGASTLTVNWASAVNGTVLWTNYSNATGSVVDQAVGTYMSGSNTVFSQLLTNLQTNDAVLSSYLRNISAAPTAQTGTARNTSNNSTQSQDQVQAGTGAITPSFTFAAGTSGIILAVSLQNNAPAASAGSFFLLPPFRL